jgi:hydroxymethylglutaryl-CoA lyase
MENDIPQNRINSAILFEDETLRDGLQMEARLFNLEEKIRIFNLLVEAGLKRIQVGSFVHPKLVPQMADTDELVRTLLATPGVLLTGLILNEKGLERALACELTHVSMSVSASDTHSRKNANRSAEEALNSMTALISKAREAGLSVRAGVQCAFGCVYEGGIPEEKVVATAEAMASEGAKEINLADTTGMGNPVQVRRLVGKIRKNLPEQAVSLHLHDTRGLGLTNMLAGYEEGVRIFDVCSGGLGGCPFVKGAAGNVPTEDAVHMFEAIGLDTGIDLQNMGKVVEELEAILGRQLPGRMTRVLKATQSHG